MKFTLQCLALALFGLLAASVIARQKDEPSEADWVKQLPDTEGVAQLADGVLHIGPYRSGPFMLRLESKPPFGFVSGHVEGEYRTSGLVPMQPKVQITFYAGKERASTAIFELSAAPDWTPFDVPIRRPPAGADRVAVAFGLLYPTDGFLEVKDVQVSNRADAPAFPADPGPLTRAAAPSGMSRSNLWRLEQSNETWWLISPEGKPFYSLGTRPPCTADGVAKLRGLDFNTVAGGATPQQWIALNDELAAQHHPYIPQFVTIFTDGSGKSYDISQDGNGRHPPAGHVFPDVFDPRWEPAMRARVRAIASQVQGKPYVVAWFMDNERHHRDLPRFLYSAHCADELKKFLEKEYSSVSAMNAVWKSNYGSFDELMAKKPDPGPIDGAQYKDYHAFARLLVKRYVDSILRAIHDEDPGRLVFSNRFMLGETADLFDYLDLYAGCDGIAINLYPSNVNAGLAPEERDLLQEVNRRMHKPIVVSEWSVPALDSGFYSDPKKSSGSGAAAVETQSDRGRQAAKITVDFYNLPFVVGSHWFTWDEFKDDQGRQSNRGLYRADGRPWKELQEAIQETNRQILARE